MKKAALFMLTSLALAAGCTAEKTNSATTASDASESIGSTVETTSTNASADNNTLSGHDASPMLQPEEVKQGSIEGGEDNSPKAASTL